MNFKEDIEPILSSIRERIPVAPPVYLTAEGRGRTSYYIDRFREGTISEDRLAYLLTNLGMPEEEIRIILDLELTRKEKAT